MQINRTSLQTDNQASTSSLKFFTGWMVDALSDTPRVTILFQQ